MFKAGIISLFTVLFASVSWAQTSLDFYLPDDDYSSDIPTPESVIGHEVGEWHVTHDKLLMYMKALSEASDRVTIEEQGYTYEDRPLVLLTITSPENHSNIDRIKQNQKMLTDPGISGDMDISGMPLIVYLGYSVHGDESSGSNASLLVAYHLAAAQSEDVEDLLENTVILIDPSLNPDGLNRFATWVNMYKSETQVTDPNSQEFNQMWPGGRTNHYWFDLNRDWFSVQHPSSQGRVQQFHDWKPNILADFHEMDTNSTYFFQPGVPERTHPLTPLLNQDLTMAIAEYHADAMDEEQQLYFTREQYDDFYYGKGSTYPDVQGSIGILFEQASSRGHAQESIYGVKTFPSTIRNQVVTSLSTLQASGDLKEDLQEYMREFYADALQEGINSSIKGYIFGDGDDQGKTWHMVDLIKQHDIEIYELAEDLTIDDHEFNQGDAFVVPVDQPQYRLITSMFERRTVFEDSLFYDISSWTLPYAFNLPFAELDSETINGDILGNLADQMPMPSGEISGGRSSYSYLFEWDEYYAPRALYRLQEEGVRTMVASRPFTTITLTGSKNFDYGTIQIPLGIQDDTVDEQMIFRILTESAREDGVTFYSAERGLNSEGIDLGSPSFLPLEKPAVALVTGSGVSTNEAGEVWHLFDQRYHIPVTLLDKDRLRSADLSRYNVMVVVSGSYGDLSDQTVSNVTSWLREGGVLITIGDALDWTNDIELTDVEYVRADVNAPWPQAYADLNYMRDAQSIGGSIFHGKLDLTHPIGYGFNREDITLFRNSTDFLRVSGNPFGTPVSYTDEPLASGYISEENLQAASGTASVVISSHGRGRIISMIDNPNFRAFWFGTNKLFMNAVFFGQTITSYSTN